jgi:hypothetical protein
MRKAELSVHGLPAGVLEEIEYGKKFRLKILPSCPEKTGILNTTHPWKKSYPLSKNSAPFPPLKNQSCLL